MLARRWLMCAVALGALTCSATSFADSMDPALGRLVLDNNCRTGGPTGAGDYYNPASGFRRCRPTDQAFAKLAAELGGAIAPLASHPARTSGFGGYRVSLNGSFTFIDPNAHYWKFGTQGAKDTTSGLDSIVNRTPDDVVQVYSIGLAKGFPFGFELGANFGYIGNTNMVVVGGDVRLALFEGFRKSIPGFLPDVGVGGGVRTLTGTSEMKLTVASFDAQLSKPIHIAGTVILHPHVGYQWLRIFGDSGLIDLTPNTDPITACGYRGDNNPATPDADKSAFDGQPNCSGSSADFNNNVVFDAIRLTRHRINFGAQLRYQMMYFGVHAITDILTPAEANTKKLDVVDPSDPSGQTTLQLNNFEDDPRTEGNDALKAQWTMSVELGAAF